MSDAPVADRYSDIIAASAQPGRHHSRRRGSRSSQGRRNRLRSVYFGIAALWGFVVGAGAMLAWLVSRGLTIETTPAAVGMMAGAGVIALAGGTLASKAYREIVGRRDR